MEIYTFVYNNKSLASFGMMTIPPEDVQQFVSKNIIRGEQTALRPRPNHFSTVYNDTLIFNFLIIRSDVCDSQDDYILTDIEINSLRAWLESPKTPTELIPIRTDFSSDIIYFGVFTNVQPFIFDGACYGLYLTFTCDAPYGYSFPKRNSIMPRDASNIIWSITNESAELNEPLYPIITIRSSSTFGTSESISIKNVTDNNNEMILSLPHNRSKIIIDCQKKIIKDESGNLISLSDVGVTIPQNSTYNFISTDMFVFYWLSLLPGTNNLVVRLSNVNTIIEVIFEHREIIKLGGF